jgi:hypothetical protein
VGGQGERFDAFGGHEFAGGGGPGGRLVGQVNLVRLVTKVSLPITNPLDITN